MPTNLLTHISRNQSRSCLVPECNHQRDSVANYCVRHKEARRLYGHPLGRRIRRAEYKPELKEVSEIISAALSANHPAITEAVGVIDGWMKAASNHIRVFAADNMRRLHENEVSAEEILTEAAATWLYFRRRSHLDDVNQLTYAIGTNVLYLAPRDVKPSGTPRAITGRPRKEAGQFIKDYFTPLFVNIEKRLEADKQANIDAVEALRIPL